MSTVVGIIAKKGAPVREAREEITPIPEEIRLRTLREMGEVLKVLGKIDADYLTYQDQKRLGSAVGRLCDLEAVFAPPPVQISKGMKLSKLDKRVLVHIRRRGRVLRSALLVSLSRYHITAADLTAAVGSLVRAGIVSEHRELAGNGHVKTTYSVVPRAEIA